MFVYIVHLLASLHTSMDLSKTGEGNVLYSSASPVGGGEKEGVGKGREGGNFCER
jgi:hypothetical protein